MDTVSKVAMLGISILLITIYCVMISFAATGTSDNDAQRKKSIGIILGVAIGIILLLTIVVLIYFTSNPAYVNTYLIGMSHFNLLLSIVAVSVATMSLQ